MWKGILASFYFLLLQPWHHISPQWHHGFEVTASNDTSASEALQNKCIWCSWFYKTLMKSRPEQIFLLSPFSVYLHTPIQILWITPCWSAQDPESTFDGGNLGIKELKMHSWVYPARLNFSSTPCFLNQWHLEGIPAWTAPPREAASKPPLIALSGEHGFWTLLSNFRAAVWCEPWFSVDLPCWNEDQDLAAFCFQQIFLELGICWSLMLANKQRQLPFPV